MLIVLFCGSPEAPLLEHFGSLQSPNLSVVFLRQIFCRRLLMLLQVRSFANNFNDCNRSGYVGVLQQRLARVVLAALAGRATGNWAIALSINTLRLKRISLSCLSTAARNPLLRSAMSTKRRRRVRPARPWHRTRAPKSGLRVLSVLPVIDD